MKTILTCAFSVMFASMTIAADNMMIQGDDDMEDENRVSRRMGPMAMPQDDMMMQQGREEMMDEEEPRAF